MGIQLSWHDPNGIEEGYRVYRGESPLDPQNLPQPLVSLPAEAETYEDNDVEPGQTYHYIVSAFIGGEEMLGDPVQAVAKSPTRFYMVNVSTRLYTYDLTGENINERNSYNVNHLAIDGLENLYFVESDGSLTKLSPDGTITELWVGSAGGAWDVVILDDGSTVLVSLDKYVRRIDPYGELMWSDLQSDIIDTVSLSTDGEYLVTGNRDGKVTKYTIDGTFEWEVAPSTSTVLSVCYHSDGNIYHTAGGILYCLSGVDGSVIDSIATNTIRYMMEYDGDLIMANGNEVVRMTTDFDRVWGVNIDGTYVAEVDVNDDGNIAFYTSGRRFGIFSADGDVVLDKYTSNTIKGVTLSKPNFNPVPPSFTTGENA